MFEELHIRNYRIFRDLKVSQLGSINLFAGRNNSGKTSLLEAVFLLSGAGNARMLVNSNIVRVDPGTTVIGDTFWKPFFSDLDKNRPIEISGCYAPIGQLSLEITWGGQQTRETQTDYISAQNVTNLSDELSLVVRYSGPKGKQVESNIFSEDKELKVEQPDIDVPFRVASLHPSIVSNRDDAIRLATLRKQKSDHLLLEALQVVEPRLQSIEDNSASGTPLIWGDIGLPELIPLAVMGDAMNRIARIVLAITGAPKGVVLVDEVENGIHHSVLPEVWRVIHKVSMQLNTQVIATTHSLECVRAAHETLSEEDFRLHRLEAGDDGNRCVTYDSESISAALDFNLEVR